MNMLSFGVGEAAGIITAVSWALSCQVHTMAGRVIGSGGVSVARVPLYVSTVGVVALLTASNYYIPPEALLLLACSAAMGITVGDPAFYGACLALGPRLALLLQSLSSTIAAILGWFFLDEHIGFTGAAGILITTSGVAFVLMEGGFKSNTELGSLPRAALLRGLGMGFLSASALAFSFILVKKALLLSIDPVWAAFVRMGIGGSLIWIVAMMRGVFLPIMRQAWTNRYTIRLLVYGALVSVVGNSLMPVAMKYTETGIATTLVGLQPILIIPIVAVVDKKRPSARAIIGTGIAFCGSAILFLR